MQSSEKLIFWYVRIPGELRFGDVNVCRVPTFNDERTENQPNSVKRDVGGFTPQSVAQRLSTRFSDITTWRNPTAWQVAGKRPVGPRHAHAQ